MSFIAKVNNFNYFSYYSYTIIIPVQFSTSSPCHNVKLLLKYTVAFVLFILDDNYSTIGCMNALVEDYMHFCLSKSIFWCLFVSCLFHVNCYWNICAWQCVIKIFYIYIYMYSYILVLALKMYRIPQKSVYLFSKGNFINNWLIFWRFLDPTDSNFFNWEVTWQYIKS